MMSRWLKRILPHGLYGRAALILIVPIVTIQLAVSIIFIQRHYEDVTEQMTSNILREIGFLIAEVEARDSLPDARQEIDRMQAPFAIDVELPSNSALSNGRLFYDFSGLVVMRLLRDAFPQIEAIDLATDDDVVSLILPTRHGQMQLEFARRRVSASNPHQLLVLMIFVSLLMTVIAYLYLRNQLRPIKRLARASEAFGKGQVIPYYPSGATEVRAAGGAFLNMRARIERQIEQRTSMLSGVSHDLRTPLTRMRLGLSMMEPEEERRALENDIVDMEHMLDAFLNFAKGDAGDALEECDAVVIAQEAVERIGRLGGAITFQKPSTPIEVQVKPRAVARALDNLLENAVRYAHRAVLSIEVEEHRLCFIVEDDGPGIEETEYENALKPFHRLEPGRNQNKATGTGLGLSIAADVARAHGGALILGRSADYGGLRAELSLAR